MTRKSDKFKVLAILLTFQLVITRGFSNSASSGPTYYEEAWSSQCVNTNISKSLPPVVVKPHPVNQSLAFILLKSRTAVRICDELTNIVVLEVSKSTKVGWTKDKSPLETLIPGNLHIQKKLIKKIVESGIQQLLRAKVFLDVVMSDTSEYVKKISELELKTMEVLCEMYSVMKTLKDKSKPKVPENSITQGHQDLLDLPRHKRNYFIAKSLRQILENVVETLKPFTPITFSGRATNVHVQLRKNSTAI